MAELLCLGQIDNAASPGAAAGKVYYKSLAGYGSSVGTNDVKLVFETQDFAPMGPLGRCIARRLHVAIEYGGSVSIRVTPITDFQDSQASYQFDITAPSVGRNRKVLDVPMAKACTYVRCKVEVLSRSGLVWLHGVRLAHRPLATAYEQIAGKDA